MKKFVAYICILLVFIGVAVGMNVGYNSDIILYSTMEDFRNEKLQEMLKAAYPNKKIQLQYMSTGNLAAKINAEKGRTDCDIIVELESAYMEMVKDSLADVSNYDQGQYLDKYNVGGGQYLPSSVYSYSVMYNESTLNKLGLPIPQTYENLLDPIYAGSIVMPSPKASGTGYIFLTSMLNLYGEEGGWDYFDRLDKNIKQYTSSGSGPVNALVRGEAPIGVGLAFQGALQVSNGVDIKFMDVPVGYNLCGMGIVKGKEKNAFVQEIFQFIMNEYLAYDNKHFLPEPILKNAPPSEVKNYPVIRPIEMQNVNDINEKQRILDLWNY